MYNDNRVYSCESGGDKDKCFPYSILSKQQQQQQQQLQQHLQRYYSSQQPAPSAGQAFRNYPAGSLPPQVTHSPLSVQGASFYTNTMVTDVGICFSMSNVNLNSDYPPFLGHPSLSVLGKGYGDPAPPAASYAPPTVRPKFRSSPPNFKPRNVTPPSGLPMPSTHTSPSTSPYSVPYSPHYFAHPKIPVKIYNNRVAPYVPIPTNSASSASAAAAYGQQLNNYYPTTTLPSGSKTLPKTSIVATTKPRQNASKTLMNNQYYDFCLTQCTKALPSYSPPSSVAPQPSTSPPQVDSPINVDGDVDPGDELDMMADVPPLPDDDDDEVEEEENHNEPKDFSLKTLTARPERQDSEECTRRASSGPPKKKWIRQHMKDEPLVNGHSTAPPLVVISTNGSSSSHQKHHAAVSSLTIDLSTKSNSNSSSSSTGSSTGIIGHRLSSTPPSSGCSSSSSTLTISPVDDSQSSLNLSGGSTSGYITSHSANSSSSLNLSGSSPLPINGGGGGSSVIATTSHGSNSSPLPHDLVIVQQQQSQQGSQISHHHHLVQGAGQSSSHHGGGLTSTSTLLNHIPTGGRRRTTSSNSNGVGTREVHNKLEKNRRAHLKECFEQLKKQLTLQPDEKKTSNLSILHAAIRYIQVLKRKEREYEHEMERLAKEKIASQNRILVLKREMSQWGDVDFSRLAPDTDAIPNSSSSTSSASTTINGVQTDRDLLNDPPGIAPGRNGIRYSSSSSLSSVATTASIGNLPLQTTISPVLIAASSPSRASPPSSSSANRNSNSPATAMPMPLSLTTKGGSTVVVSDTHNGTPSPLKFSTTSLPNGLNLSTAATTTTTGITNGFSNGGSSSGGSNCSTPNSTTSGSIVTNGINGTALPLIVNANNIGSLGQNQIFTPVTATILTAPNGTAIQTLPLNLNVASSISNGHHLSSSSSIVSTSNGMTGTGGLQIIGTTANGTTIPAGLISSTTGKELFNGATTTLTKNGFRTTDGSNKIEIIATQASAAGSALEPPATKVIKLVNGNTLVGVTSIDKDKMMLSQVVPQGGLVMSPIQLLTPQGLRVIQQAPNGLATIELSTAANVQPQSNPAQRTTVGSSLHSSTNSSNPSHLTSASSQPSLNQSASSNHNHQHHHIQTVTGAQLHKLLISSSSAGSNGITTISSNTGGAGGYSNGSSPSTTITPELARLPGGAELNILPAGTNGATALPLYRATTGQGGKLTFVNAISTGGGTGLTLKGTDSSATGTGRTTALHVVTPIQTGSAQLSGLTPVVVSRYDPDATGHHMIGPFTTSAAATGPPQTTQLGKMVKTVGQSAVSGLPLIAAAIPGNAATRYFNSGGGGGDGDINNSGTNGPAAPGLVLLDRRVPPPSASSSSSSSSSSLSVASGSYNDNGEELTTIAI